MVIINHAVIPYVPNSDWRLYHTSIPGEVIYSSSYFVGINIAYIMSLFFFISGFMFPISYERNGNDQFLRKKLFRLGIPFVVFTIVHSLLLNQFDVGHLWYLQSLVLLAITYSIIRRYFPMVPIFYVKPTLLLFILIAGFLGLFTLIIRQYFPWGTIRYVLRIIYVDLAHLPQYFLMFILGVFFNKLGLLQRITKVTGISMLIISLLLLIVYVLFYGANVYVKVYSFAESFFCVFFNIGLLVTFREYANKTNTFISRCTSLSYGAHIVHLHILMILFNLLDSQEIDVRIKFGIISLLGVILSFFITYLLKKNSYISKII